LFQKNRAPSETALTELHRKASVQTLKSATQYCTTVDLGKSAIVKRAIAGDTCNSEPEKDRLDQVLFHYDTSGKINM
jgi:hypothetical protein